jgi:thiamine kinase-like enzyme/UTP-glucose-1-phosphate uridylyltransferase
MKYKVCVLAAGKGSRLSYAKDYNKALVPVGEKSALTRIIEKFPKEVEIVIAVGYNAEFLRDFIKIAHPNRKITLVEVDKYEGEGSGPGYSLYFCRRHLQCPFIFTSVDTIVLESVPEPSFNWLGVAKADNPESYSMAGVYNGLVKKFYIKVPMAELLKSAEDPKTVLNNAFIGMAGVTDYKDFWKGFEKDRKIVQGEVQVMDGLRALTEKKLLPQSFTWFDTGNDLGYYFTNQHFNKLNLLTKPDEFIYFENGKVIKYFANEKIAANRIKRAALLKGIVPNLSYQSKHFYAYDFIEGVTLNKVNDTGVFNDFLDFCEQKLWQPIKIGKSAQIKFAEAVKRFYFNKTNERLAKFYEETNIEDKPGKINGVKVPTLKELLNALDWDPICKGTPVLFHGDLQPENVLVHKKDFTLIDWRQDFGGLVDYGDIYYDFGKLYHALIISNEVIRKNEFEVSQENGDIKISYLIKNNLWEFKEEFERFLVQKGYDLKKVKILAALIFLNIAPLSHYPYNLFMYYLGKSELHKILTNK